MDPETRQFEMAAKTVLPAVTKNCLPEVVRRFILNRVQSL